MTNVLYRILGGLFLLSILSGMAGIGVSGNGSHSRNPYLLLLKKIKFFDSRDYSTQMSRDRERDVMRSREKQMEYRKSTDDRLKDQRLALAMQNEQKPQAVPPAVMTAEDRNKEVRERLADLRYKNLDTQERYRQLIDAQRFK